jgi:phosphoribosylglycinamide formyltransferase-1
VAVNLIADLTEERFGEAAPARAPVPGYQLVHAATPSDRLAAWIDWQFAPSWWSAEARAGEVWYALDGAGDIVGFAGFAAHGLRFPWLRGYERQRDVGLFGPFGVAPAHRKTGLGAALLEAALRSLRARGYARALIPAVGYERLEAMYRERVGARVAERYTYDSPRRFRTTILASGSGTNAQHVFDRVADGRLPLALGAVVSNVAGAPVEARATRAGIALHRVVWERGKESRSAFDARVIEAVAKTEPELVLLLGWMHFLPPAFIERFPEILNVHPAFLPNDVLADDVVLPDGSAMPAFRGAHALRDALAAGAAWTGASVHRVTNEVDRGAVLVRTPLRLADVAPGSSVADALRPVEHAAVSAAVRRWCFEQSA